MNAISNQDDEAIILNCRASTSIFPNAKKGNMMNHSQISDFLIPMAMICDE